MELKNHVQQSHSLWIIWEQSLIITRFSHLNDIFKTKKGTKISKFISWKGFGEYIWHLILSIKISHVNFLPLEEFSMHVELEINVFCALIKFMIYHQMHNRLIFTIQAIGLLLMGRQDKKEVSKTKQLISCKGKSFFIVEAIMHEHFCVILQIWTWLRKFIQPILDFWSSRSQAQSQSTSFNRW
jgi:hypothetical protein